MKLTALRITIVLLLAISTAAFADTAMQTFSSKDGGFTISMPGTPKETVQTVDSAAGPLELHQFLVEDGTIAYIVMYNDYPRTPDNQETFFTTSAMAG